MLGFLRRLDHARPDLLKLRSLVLGRQGAGCKLANFAGQGTKLMANMIMQFARYSPALVFLIPHETGGQGAYFVAASRQVCCKPLFDFMGAFSLGDVMNRSNQMGTSGCIVKDRCNADFPAQPPIRVLKC